MKWKTEEALTELRNGQSGMCSLVRGLDSKEVEGGRCLRGSDKKLCFSEKEVKSGRIIWK